MTGNPKRRECQVWHRLIMIQKHKKLKIEKPDSTATLPGQAFIISAAKNLVFCLFMSITVTLYGFLPPIRYP